MLKHYFVTGTDTDVGKTLTSAILTLALQGSYWKPIQSGMESIDCKQVQHLTGLDDSHFISSKYIFKAPLSPDQAATLEQRTVDLNSCHLPNTSKPLIVEGAGGVYVPLNHDKCMLDLMKKLALPIVIVSRGTLGTINHTLLTIQALRQYELTIHGIIFSGELNPDNQAAIERWGNVKTLFHIPKFEKMTPLEIQTWTMKNKKEIREQLL